MTGNTSVACYFSYCMPKTQSLASQKRERQRTHPKTLEFKAKVSALLQKAKPEVAYALALELELQRQAHVNTLNRTVGSAIGGHVVLDALLGENKCRYKTQIYKAVYPQVAHEAQVKARFPGGGSPPYGIGSGKRLGVMYLVLGVIETEGDTEIIHLVVVLAHVECMALGTSLRQGRSKHQQT